MKRLFVLLFVLALVTLVVTPVRNAEAAPPGCFCGGYEYTPQLWAQGSSCAEAQANLRAAAMAYVDCPNGRCGLELVYTAVCHWDTYTGMYQSDGYIRFRCWYCEE